MCVYKNEIFVSEKMKYGLFTLWMMFLLVMKTFYRTCLYIKTTFAERTNLIFNAYVQQMKAFGGYPKYGHFSLTAQGYVKQLDKIKISLQCTVKKRIDFCTFFLRFLIFITMERLDNQKVIALLVGGLEYTNCISCRVVRSL